MMALRKLVCKPKLDDWAPLAKFYYADEALNAIANELDCFDGRKDPERCQQLVNQLRHCQDRVIQIIDEILSDAFPNQSERAPRDYRVKFPDDILHDNFPGQLWFGAECLSAGSNIMDRESESDSIRPLAKKLTCHLDRLREALKEQSLKNPLFYSEKVKNALHIYDELFSEFELCYVSAMVPVKTVREYDMQQDVAVLFSETLCRAISKCYITQDMIDICEPSIMITLPRLAIVSGLLFYPDGPLNVNLPAEKLADMFQPFKTLLQKIRDLLYTLSEEELYTLERALSSLEQLPFDECKVTLISDYRNRSAVKKFRIPNSKDLTSDSVLLDSNKNVTIATANPLDVVVMPSPVQLPLVPSEDEFNANLLNPNISSTPVSVVKETSVDFPAVQLSATGLSSTDGNKNMQIFHPASTAAPTISSTSASLDSTNDLVKTTRDKVLRSRFRSPEDLIHRLFVCIAGVADQWQSNYPSDLRAVLKMVFQSQDSAENIYEVNGGQGGGDESGTEVAEQSHSENSSIVVPWVPDHECPNCTECQRNFTFVLRRHHCRNCGKIFCARCSGNFLMLPKLGYSKPVRVCNQCFFYKLPSSNNVPDHDDRDVTVESTG